MNLESLRRLNAATTEAAVDQLRKCCGTAWWCEQMAARRPYESVQRLHAIANEVCDEMTDAQWREAFACHPKIGDLESLRMKFAGNRDWSSGEQAGVTAANEQTLRELAEGNAAYEAKFSYIFIVCATGKSADEMLQILQRRLQNDPADELGIAAAEQRKITHLRIDKLEVSG